MAWERTESSGDARRLTIWAFPEGDDLWRIDWFGPIAFPNRYAKQSEPSVLVYLSKVIDPALRDDPTRPISPASTAPRPIKRWVSIGQAVLLRIGDLWMGQDWYCRPAYEEERFQRLDVSRSKPRSSRPAQVWNRVPALSDCEEAAPVHADGPHHPSATHLMKLAAPSTLGD